MYVAASRLRRRVPPPHSPKANSKQTTRQKTELPERKSNGYGIKPEQSCKQPTTSTTLSLDRHISVCSSSSSSARTFSTQSSVNMNMNNKTNAPATPSSAFRSRVMKHLSKPITCSKSHHSSLTSKSFRSKSPRNLLIAQQCSVVERKRSASMNAIAQMALIASRHTEAALANVNLMAQVIVVPLELNLKPKHCRALRITWLKLKEQSHYNATAVMTRVWDRFARIDSKVSKMFITAAFTRGEQQTQQHQMMAQNRLVCSDVQPTTRVRMRSLFEHHKKNNVGVPPATKLHASTSKLHTCPNSNGIGNGTAPFSPGTLGCTIRDHARFLAELFDELIKLINQNDSEHDLAQMCGIRLHEIGLHHSRVCQLGLTRTQWDNLGEACVDVIACHDAVRSVHDGSRAWMILIAAVFDYVAAVCDQHKRKRQVQKLKP